MIPDSFFDTPLGRTIDRHQSEGAHVYVWGLTRAQDRALIVHVESVGPDGPTGTASVAHVNVCNGIGRWECSARHLNANADMYAERFPIR